MSLVEGYPELNFYDQSNSFQAPAPLTKEQRSLFALETQLQKTKLCRYHMKGLCKHGSDCRFAHGKDQLVEPPNLEKTRMCSDFLENGVCNNPNCTFAHQESELKKANICRKTAICTWFLAGNCRNGEECDFAHGEHELRGNANPVNNRNQQSQKEQSQTSDNGGYKRKEPMFIESTITSSTHQSPESTQWSHDAQFQPSMQHMTPAAPPFVMPSYMPGMQPYGYPAPLQQNPYAYSMGMQPPPMMQLPGVEPTGTLPPGLPMVPNPVAASPLNSSQKSWQLTELAVQINMLSEEVKRLQDYVIPRSVQSTNSGSHVQSTNSGSSTRSSSGDNRTPRAGEAVPGKAAADSAGSAGSTGSGSSNGVPDLSDSRSFEEHLAYLQNELKRVMEEGANLSTLMKHQA